SNEHHNSKIANDIHNDFANDELLSYLLFLEFTLNTFNEFNAIFQNRETDIHILAERSGWMLKQMTMYFLKPDCLNNVTINSIVTENILPTLSIKVGDKFQNLLNSFDHEIVLKIK
ncbi:hypothetical protein PV327_011721, partial [Microctonus hyperodae]